jgi:hypothetical protein
MSTIGVVSSVNGVITVEVIKSVTEVKVEVIKSVTEVTVEHVGIQGLKGDTGAPGDLTSRFETVSKNLLSWDFTISRTSGDIVSIIYTDGVSTIVKTFNYTTGDLTSIVLSGDTPAGIDLIKTLGYTAGNLTSVTYS